MKYSYALIRQRYKEKNDVVEENYNKSNYQKIYFTDLQRTILKTF